MAPIGKDSPDERGIIKVTLESGVKNTDTGEVIPLVTTELEIQVTRSTVGDSTSLGGLSGKARNNYDNIRWDENN